MCKGEKVKKLNIFLSYCRYDDKIADDIYNYFRLLLSSSTLAGQSL